MAVRETTPRDGESLLEVEQTFGDRLRYLGRLLWRDKSGMIGVLMFLTVVLAATFAPVLSTYPPLEQNLIDNKQPPAWNEEGSWDHPFGTDNLGRDIYSRILYGARVSLTVGFFWGSDRGDIGTDYRFYCRVQRWADRCQHYGRNQSYFSAALSALCCIYRGYPRSQFDQRDINLRHHRFTHLRQGHAR